MTLRKMTSESYMSQKEYVLLNNDKKISFLLTYTLIKTDENIGPFRIYSEKY